MTDQVANAEAGRVRRATRAKRARFMGRNLKPFSF